LILSLALALSSALVELERTRLQVHKPIPVNQLAGRLLFMAMFSRRVLQVRFCMVQTSTTWGHDFLYAAIPMPFTVASYNGLADSYINPA
jgi:hypothetical protein